IVRCKVKNVPLFISVDDGFFERLVLENCVMHNVKNVIEMAMEYSSLSQINIKSLSVDNSSVLVKFKDTLRECSISEGVYSYEFGTMICDSETERNIRERLEKLDDINESDMLRSDLRHAPSTDTWVDVTTLGLIGDGKFDNTLLLNDAIKKYDVLFFPQGDYIFTNQITLERNTVIIGMHPFSTKLILKENSEAYTGFGSMKPFVESAWDSDNMINGIGIDTGGRNPRACALLWHGSGQSYINDVKLIGCHGTLVEGTGEFLSPYNESRTADADIRKQWDAQYPSLVVKNGGGIFKDIWSASTYSISGVEIVESHIPSKVYCISLEHHQRSEITVRDSSNWKFYAIQTEEEFAEGEFACPIVIRNSSDLEFNMAYFFRTIWVNRACPCCVRVYGGDNIAFNCINNVTQMKYTFDNFLIYESKDGYKVIRPWQATKVLVGRSFDDSYKICNQSDIKFTKAEVVRSYDGFRFADGTVLDSKGNLYFVDSTDKRIYKIDKEDGSISLILDCPIKVNSLTVDTEDNLVGVGEYFIPAEATVDGVEIDNTLPEDAHFTSYGKWYYPNVVIVAFSVDEGQITPLEKIKMGSFKPERVVYSGNRWLDDLKFTRVVQYKAEKAFLMPDGCSVIPCQYDLIRANNLVSCRCGESFYSVDEMYKSVYVCDTDEYGYVSNPRQVTEQGDYCVRTGSLGDIFVGDDNIKHFNKGGELIEIIQMKERPTTFELDEKGNVSYVATRHSVYKIKY
ncbi:MAG: hypothetical protein IKN54_08205, partial [Lachnospiraceae bacterium]|nr:hypothetical protein [Lachnospiraceae bacterium]